MGKPRKIRPLDQATTAPTPLEGEILVVGDVAVAKTKHGDHASPHEIKTRQRMINVLNLAGLTIPEIVTALNESNRFSIPASEFMVMKDMKAIQEQAKNKVEAFEPTAEAGHIMVQYDLLFEQAMTQYFAIPIGNAGKHRFLELAKELVSSKHKFLQDVGKLEKAGTKNVVTHRHEVIDKFSADQVKAIEDMMFEMALQRQEKDVRAPEFGSGIDQGTGLLLPEPELDESIGLEQTGLEGDPVGEETDNQLEGAGPSASIEQRLHILQPLASAVSMNVSLVPPVLAVPQVPVDRPMDRPNGLPGMKGRTVYTGVIPTFLGTLEADVDDFLNN